MQQASGQEKKSLQTGFVVKGKGFTLLATAPRFLIDLGTHKSDDNATETNLFTANSRFTFQVMLPIASIVGKEKQC